MGGRQLHLTVEGNVRACQQRLEEANEESDVMMMEAALEGCRELFEVMGSSLSEELQELVGVLPLTAAVARAPPSFSIII